MNGIPAIPKGPGHDYLVQRGEKRGYFDPDPDLLEVLRKAQESTMIKHPQLINGTLYVTPEQYDALAELATDQKTSRLSALDTPVVKLEPNQPHKLSEDQIILYVPALKGIYLLNADIFFPPIRVDDYPLKKRGRLS